jgi:endonuclease/exonuclease/phosphatase family metal-dependent hydrolase
LKRLAQATQIRKAVDHLLERDPDARVVVLGDFNDTLESEPLRIVLGDARACASPGLAQAELVACELAVPEDLRFTQIYRGRRETIDHILSSRGLLPHFTGARVLNEALRESEEDPSRGSFTVGSDHAPLVAEFRV